MSIGMSRDQSYNTGEIAPLGEKMTIATGHPSENDLRKEHGLDLRHDEGGDDTRPEALS
jgi:hypothetical protein